MYGAEENDVWEGLGSSVQLAEGPATITLSVDADSNLATADSPLANRNVDVVMLFPNTTDMEARQAYGESNVMDLAGDGLLSQSGEVYFQVVNHGPAELNLTVPHSHYYSIGPDNHLTNGNFNPVTQKLESGCTPRGENEYRRGEFVSHKALPFCCVSTVFLSKAVPFRAVLLPQATPQTPGGPKCPRAGVLPVGKTSHWFEVGSVLGACVCVRAAAAVSLGCSSHYCLVSARDALHANRF
jgi:hypothetical protein